MIFDSHMHTKFSADSEMLAEDAINKSQKLGYGVVFTEHFDFDLPGDVDFTFVPKDYWNEYKNFRSNNVRLGVEIGMEEHSRQACSDFIKKVPFDLVIGSIHLVDRFDIYYPEYYEGKDKETAYKKYFQAMEEEAAIGDFDILGHIDYICRAAPYENPEIDYQSFKNEIDKILKILVERNKVLELNTRRFNNKRGIKELIPIYKKYKELGGKYVTIGSDAHRVEAVCNYFDLAIDFVNNLNLKVVTFCERQLEICD